MKKPISFIAIVAVVIGVAILIAGCSTSSTSGVFVDKGRTEVIMIRMVESSSRHLAGSMVLTMLKHDGSEKAYDYSLDGSIKGYNVSLQIEAPKLLRLFSSNTIWVGNLRGQILTLSFGNSTRKFHKVSNQVYQDDIAGLYATGHHIALVLQSIKAFKNIISYDKGVNLSLRHYISWGQERINHVSIVNNWYANRIAHYTICLNHIRPLATLTFLHGNGRNVF